jgi:AcrR family transcriptional regulator
MSTVESPPVGLRERKKEQTRQLIAETARRLFGERGFERVTVAEIARAAEVSEQTVFNYFPTKEDLVYWRLQSFEDELLGTIRDREPGEPALAAFRRFLLAQRGLLGKQDPQAREELAALTRMITESPALLAREEQIFAGYTASLAALLAQETGSDAADLRPSVAANAMMGRPPGPRAPRPPAGGRGHAPSQAGRGGPHARRGGAGAARRGPRGLRRQGLKRSAAISKPDAAMAVTARTWFHGVQSER